MRRILHIEIRTVAVVAMAAATILCGSFLITKAADLAPSTTANGQVVGLFDGMQSGDLQVRLVPKDDRQAQILIKNNSNQPLSVKLPDSFVGMPVLAQAAGGGVGTTTRNTSSNKSNQNQTVGGGGGGGGIGGGGGGIFNIAPETTGKVKVSVVCLEHGKADPNERVAYEIRPMTAFTTDPRLQALMKILGSGQIDQRAAQAAAWYLSNNMSWSELAAKKLNHVGQPYFTAGQLKDAMALVNQADQQAKVNPTMDQYADPYAKPSDDSSPADAISASAKYSEQDAGGKPAN